MKKRLFCLVLCLLLVFPVVLASCGKRGGQEAISGITDDASENTATVSMWLVTETPLSDATIKAVSTELTSITESKFHTRLLLTFVTRDVYEAKLAEEIEQFEAVNKDLLEEDEMEDDEDMTEGTTEAKGPETDTNEYGLVVYKYPEKLPHQVDIIYVASEGMFRTYVNNGWLAPLDTYLATSAKKLKEYVSATLLDAVQQGGKTYAIPNNNVIGEYTYMLLNKRLMDKYFYNGYINQKRIDGLFNELVYNYLDTIATYEADVPLIDSTYEECLKRLAYFWSIDDSSYEMLNDFSIFGCHYSDAASLTRGSTMLGFNSLFEDEEFVSNYLQLNRFRLEGYFADVAEEDEVAIRFVQGDATIIDNYTDEYYPVIIEYPTATSGDIFDNMFAVYANSLNVERSMEIITYLNTNRDFRNILQYGVEDVHYKLIEDAAGNPLIQRIGNDYNMSLFATGNIFLAYPSEDIEVSEKVWANDWKLAKEQNRGSLVSPLLGFNFANEVQLSAGSAEEAGYEINETTGFYLDYTTGHSKEVLSSNDTIAKWLSDCDAAATKGVFVLKTLEDVDGETTYKYYVYNNNVTTDVAFHVSVDEKYNHVKDNRNRIQKVLDYLHIYFEYDPVKNPGESSYELSVVTMYFDVETPFTEFCKVEDVDTAMTVTTKEELVEVDVLHHDLYDIDFYAGLTAEGIKQNSVLTTWLENAPQTKKKVLLFTYLDQSNADKDVYNFVALFRMSDYSTMNLVPTIVDGNVVLQVVVTGSGERVDLNDDNRLMAYITVEVAKGVKVTCMEVIGTMEASSATDTENNAFSTAAIESSMGKALKINDSNSYVSEVNPEFHSFGKFDHEYLKYVNRLDDMIENLLASCETYAEFEAVVSELKVLLSTTEQPKVENFVVLADFVAENFGSNLLLKNLYDMVRLGTGMDQSPDVYYNADGSSYTVLRDIYNHEFPYTPYDIYYNWMSNNGYLPEEDD